MEKKKTMVEEKKNKARTKEKKKKRKNKKTHLNHSWLGIEEPDPRVCKHKGFTWEFENN
jgi:hypothetical protein